MTLYKQELDVGVNVGVNEIYKFITKNQPTKANLISKQFPQITQRTIERWIKLSLKAHQKLEDIL